ncbi:MAG TPA: hypothetical protein VGH28_17580 [Polyangiaceae bacterium]|jgi:hypothetical protein
MGHPNDEARELNAAIVFFLGHRRASWPQRDEAALAREFGPERAAFLREKIDALRAEIAAVEIDWATCSLASAGEAARRAMRDRHPELADEALDALAWEFTYDWK